MLASIVLVVHLLVIAFNLFGLVVMPVGAWFGWRFVHAPLWRVLHLISLGVTALQAALGKACFLTVWEMRLEGELGYASPLIMGWVNSLIYWDFPIWVFAALYVGLFAYTLALLWWVPIRFRSSR